MSLKRLLPLLGALAAAVVVAGCSGEETAAAPATAPPAPAATAAVAVAPTDVPAIEPTAVPAVAPTVARETAGAATEPTAAPPAPKPATLAPLPAGLEDSGLLVDTAWLAANVKEDGVRLLDVRSTEEFDSGHIAGAVNVPSADFTATVDGIRNLAPSAENFAAVMQAAGVSVDTRVVVVDGGNLLWAGRMFWTLEYFGHADVAVLHGGMAAWSGEGRPLTALNDPVPSGDFAAATVPERLAELDDVLERLDDSGFLVLDTRSPAEYEGEDVRSARGGHTPGAVNVNWVLTLNNTEAPTLMGAEELRALYEAAGVTADLTIATHCQTGVRGAHTFFVLRLLGYQNLELYDAGWEEWGNDPNVPIEPDVAPAAEPEPDDGSGMDGDTMDGM